MRSKHGREITYQCFGTFGLGTNFFRRGFARVTAYWQRLEVPGGCAVDLPMVFSYRMRKLLDPESPWWVVVYTDRAGKVAALILFDVYDSCRFWALRKEIVRGIRRPHLKIVLGNAGNATDCFSLLDAIERFRFREFPAEWLYRGILPSLAPGHTDVGGDYLFYNPYTARF